jgi:hypothetical protein
MAVQRLHAFEKTSIQARHSLKRLEMLVETARTPEEKEVGEILIMKFNEIRKAIPSEYQDVDLAKE